ncbi:hypothetical protein OG589_24245 [Sphaerisporangium sp. NBC_01403]|uniref:hypothetical protein n=1 Tax=Sphaerisporangium sp. NBC_01403 TaxID=2903599 RepID=UPI0032454A4E
MIRRRVEFYSYLDAYGRGHVAEDANLEERRERRRLRDRLSATLKHANSAPLCAFDNDDDFEIHPFRTRHSALWHAW